jgi:hypothetical protein
VFGQVIGRATEGTSLLCASIYMQRFAMKLCEMPVCNSQLAHCDNYFQAKVSTLAAKKNFAFIFYGQMEIKLL